MTNIESFNIKFCDDLNRFLMLVMNNSSNKLGLSCSMDGVLMPFIDYQLSKKSVNDTRKIETNA